MPDNISKSQFALNREKELALKEQEKDDKEWQDAVSLMDENNIPKKDRPSYALYKQSRDRFIPEGTGYDYYTALKEGVVPLLENDGKYHWGS